MSNSEIDAMPAGRELDRLVAERVMGWRHQPGACFPWEAPEKPTRPGAIQIVHFLEAMPYSTDLLCAWKVVDELAQFTLKRLIGRWWCQCFDGLGGVEAEGETAELAICRVALKAAASQSEALKAVADE